MDEEPEGGPRSSPLRGLGEGPGSNEPQHGGNIALPDCHGQDHGEEDIERAGDGGGDGDGSQHVRFLPVSNHAGKPGCGRTSRFCRRTTSLRPDQVASTAQTFTSTRPIGRQTSRITSSVMSVGTFDAFFGQLTQIIPAGSRNGRSSWSFTSSSPREVTKICAASIGASGDESSWRSTSSA